MSNHVKFLCLLLFFYGVGRSCVKKMWLVAIHVLVVGLNLMSVGRNLHKYMMGLHLIHVQNWIGDMNYNGIRAVLTEELG